MSSAPRFGAVALLLVALQACKLPRLDLERAPVEPPSFDFVQQETKPKDPSFWAPTPDTQKGFDWIKLKSGEWLKGTLDVMRDNELEFDSKEMDEQVFDWEDVHEVRTVHPFTVRLEDQSGAEGAVWIRDGKVHVAGEEPLTFDRADLYSLTPTGQKEISHWKGKLTIGVSEDSGNSDELDTFTTLSLRRDDNVRRLRFDYTGEYNETDGDKTDNNHRFTAKIDRYVTPSFYLSPLWLDLFKDEFQNIDLRATPSVGAGYSIFRRPELDWDVELSAGYQYIEFRSVEVGEDETDEKGSLNFSTYFDVEITKDIDFLLKYEFQGNMDDFSDNFQNTIATLSVDITKNIDFDISVTWDRVGTPEAGSDGATPDKDDFNLTIGIGFEL